MKILTDLDSKQHAPAVPEFKIAGTRENLSNASDWELEEIDSKYPQFIASIKPENHEEAIRSITYAWKSEQQHRELLTQIQSGTGMLFGWLAKKIEATRAEYYVCRVCGSTVAGLPENKCPFCGMAASEYVKIGKDR